MANEMFWGIMIGAGIVWFFYQFIYRKVPCELCTKEKPIAEMVDFQSKKPVWVCEECRTKELAEFYDN